MTLKRIQVYLLIFGLFISAISLGMLIQQILSTQNNAISKINTVSQLAALPTANYEAKPQTPGTLYVNRSITEVSNKDSMFLTWKDNAYNETSYRVERFAKPEDKSWVQISKLPANQSYFRDTTATKPFVKYCYRVRAYNGNAPTGKGGSVGGKYSSYSNDVCKMIVPKPEQFSVKSPVVGDYSDGMTQFTWMQLRPVEGVKYIVQALTSKDGEEYWYDLNKQDISRGPSEVIDDYEKISIILKVPNGDYRFRVVAVKDGEFYSFPSQEKEVKITGAR